MRPIAADGLLHPVPVTAIVLLALNDQWLKFVYHSWFTGKLSDAMGLVFFPLFVQGVIEVGQSVVGRPFRPSARLAGVVVLITGAAFTTLQLSEPVMDLYRWGLGGLQWPFAAVASAARGVALPVLNPVYANADPSDLVVLPFLLIPAWLAYQREQRWHADPEGSP